MGGTINLKSAIRVFYSYLTIAGQTAPGDGIQIIGPDSQEDLFLVWEAHDIVIRYLRFRHGYNNSVKVQAGGCYNGGNGSYNAIIDHCSFQWGMNDLAGAWSEDKPVHNYTFSNNIFAEALKVHSTNLIFGSNTNAEDIKDMDVHHNFFGNSSHRSPLFKGKSCRVINNIVYNPGWYATGIAGGVTIDIIGNEYKQGVTDMANGRNEVAWRSDYDGPNSGPSGPPSIYIADNKGWSVANPSDDNWPMVEKCAVWNPSNEQLNQSFRRNSPLAITTHPVSVEDVNAFAGQLTNHVGASQRLDASGSWVPMRDAVDQRIINDYNQGTGFIPNHEDEVGGFPTLNPGTPYSDADQDGMADAWEAAYGFDQNDASDGNQDADGDGYTNVEEFLNGTVPTTGVPNSTYVVRARGLQGTEQMALQIGGQIVKNWTVSKSMQNYSYTGSQTGAVQVAITNDQGVNHDLVIDKLTVDGTVYQAEAQAINTGVWQKGSCGGSYSQWLHCSGYIEFAVGEANARQAIQKQKPVLDQASSEVLIYPNPSQTSSFIVQGINNETQVSLYNLHGQRILIKQQPERTGKLRVQPQVTLSRGLYVVRVQTAKGTTSQHHLIIE